MTTHTPLIQAFAFDSHAVRVVSKDGQPWFVAKDVCECIDVTYYRDAIAKLDSDERGSEIVDTLGGPQEMAVINESGLFTLVLRSQGAMTPGAPAHSFRKWVTAEVLPAIRQTGSYSAPGASASANVDAKLDRVLDLMEQTLRAIHKVIEAVHPATRRPARKRMHLEDLGRIQALRAKGYTLDELVAETEFSQSQCWAVCAGRYKVLESGRISIDLRSDAARAADAAAKAERTGQLGLVA